MYIEQVEMVLTAVYFASICIFQFIPIWGDFRLL